MADANTGSKYTDHYRLERLEEDVKDLQGLVLKLRLDRARLIGIWLGGNLVLGIGAWIFSNATG